MAVDRGARGAASVYYGTGQSEQRQRESRDMNQLRTAYQEGKQAAHYNEGLDAQATELSAASVWRGRAVRKTGRTQGRM